MLNFARPYYSIMKKHIFTFLTLVSVSIGANAQITLQREDFASIDQVYANQYDSLYTLPAGFANGGASLTWDFTGLSNHGTMITRTYAASSTPYFSSFPGSNFAIQNDDQVDEYLYFKDSASVMLTTGVYSDGEPNPYAKFRAFIFPVAYGDTWSDEVEQVEQFSGADMGLPVDSVRIVVTATFNNTVDAHGQVQLPIGNKDALRIEREVLVNIKFYMLMSPLPWTLADESTDTSYMYEFYGKNTGSYIARVEETDDSSKHEVSYRTGSYAGISKAQKLSLETYPNPTTEVIHIGNAQNFNSFVMYNQLGQIVRSGKIEESGIKVGDLARGTYFISSINASGEVYQSKVTLK